MWFQIYLIFNRIVLFTSNKMHSQCSKWLFKVVISILLEVVETVGYKFWLSTYKLSTSKAVSNRKHAKIVSKRKEALNGTTKCIFNSTRIFLSDKPYHINYKVSSIDHISIDIKKTFLRVLSVLSATDFCNTDIVDGTNTFIFFMPLWIQHILHQDECRFTRTRK